MEKIKIEQHSFMGMLWFGTWLFTIGFLQLTFWKGFLAIVLWPTTSVFVSVQRFIEPSVRTSCLNHLDGLPSLA